MTSVMYSIYQDLKYAIRTFKGNPGFVAIVIVSVALGIAANTTVFSMVKATLLGQLPVREPERLVSFDESSSKSYPDFVDYRDQTKDVFEGVGAYFPLVPVSLGGGEPERIWGQLATGNYFSLMGVQPVIGRGFLPEEDRVPGRDQVVVLSYGLWMRRFGGDRSIAGRRVIMNDRPYTVVGVAPRGFHGEARGIISEFWVPLSMYAQIMPDLAKEKDITQQRNNQWLCLFGRLKPGVSRETAAAAVNVVKRRIDSEYRKPEPGRPARAFQPIRLAEAGKLPGGGAKIAMGLMAVLMVVVGLVLLIACANVANLLLARATARQREIGIRLAVGAGRRRLIRQLLTESVLLAAFGAAAGLLLALAATRGIARLQFSLPFPVGFDFSPDVRVVSFTAALTVVTGVLFGLAPALRATRTDLVTTLKGEAEAPAGRRFGMRNILVVVQVALSLVLLVSAGLFLRSLGNASSIDTGMRAENVLIMAFDPKLHSYSPERSRQFVADLRRRVAALPGVASVSFVDVVPLSIGSSSYTIRSEGEKEVKETQTDVFRIGMRYFETLGIPLLRGRDFSPHSSPDMVIINEIAAKRLFPGVDAVGRRIRAENKTYQVIAVAGNAKSRTLGEDPKACLYYFLEPNPNEVISFFGTALLVRSNGSPSALIRPVRDELRALDRNLAVFNTETMREHLNKALLMPRLSATLLTIFGLAGLVLATVGLYGVMSYSVRRRTREIGIRMALGAHSGGVLRMVAKQGMMLAAAGLAIGLAIALALSRFTASQLYGISATDPVTFLGVPAILLAVAFVASLAPARRASRIEPYIALRHD
jgi:predicted permease